MVRKANEKQRPFVNYYSSTFILYELSSPFLNFHWFFDKLSLTGSKRQLINGIFLLLTFFSCRLCWGTYQSLRVYQDMWRALHHVPVSQQLDLQKLNGTTGTVPVPVHSDIMRFAGEEFLPLWLAIIYLGSNLVLNTLNFFWFGKMIDAMRKRFQPSKKEKVKVEVKHENGTAKVTLDETSVRRRNVGEKDSIPPTA